MRRPSIGDSMPWPSLIVALCAGCGPMSQTSGASPSPPGAAMAADPAGDPAPMATGLPPVGPSPAPVDPAPGSGPGELAEPAAAHRRAPAGARAGSAPAYADAFVDAHNQRRAPHCAPPLAWSAKLAQLAQQWANSLRDQGCKFAHSGGSTGENLAAGTIGLLDPEAVVKMWYDEISQYRFPSGGFSMQTGHFTQVVWRGTSQVGCGHSQCKGLDIWVCEYDPPGNWEGQYRDNVLPKSCKK